MPETVASVPSQASWAEPRRRATLDYRRPPMKRLLVLLITLGIAAGCSSAPKLQLGGIGDTSWQLVKVQGGDGAGPTPDDKAKYTGAFTNNGNRSVRFEFNHGRGTRVLKGGDEVGV